MYFERGLDPNSHRTHRKSLRSIDNRSKKCHCHIARPALDYSSTAPEVLVSNAPNPIRNNYPSTADVTMDFSIAIALHPFFLNVKIGIFQ